MSEPDISIEEVRQAFNAANEVLAGRPFYVTLAALQDLLVGSLCFACNDKAEAKKLCRNIHKDLQKTIDKNFDHYHNPDHYQTVAPRRQAH